MVPEHLILPSIQVNKYVLSTLNDLSSLSLEYVEKLVHTDTESNPLTIHCGQAVESHCATMVILAETMIMSVAGKRTKL